MKAKKYIVVECDRQSELDDNSDIIKLKNSPYIILPEVLFRETYSSLECIKKVYSKPRNKTYVRLLQELDEFSVKSVQVINLSLLVKIDPVDDPIINILEKNIENRKIIVCAAGNKGPKIGSLNPLALIDGVISVGAVDADKKLLKNSSIGIPKKSHPTFVADGISNLPPEFLDTKPIYKARPPSTSFAAPKVSRIASAIILFINALEATVKCISDNFYYRRGAPLNIPVIIGLDTSDIVDWNIQPDWLKDLYLNREAEIFINTKNEEMLWVTQVTKFLKKNKIYVYYLSDRSFMIQKIMEDIAQPINGYQLHEIGMGYLSLELTIKYFSKFTLEKFIYFFVDSENQSKLDSLVKRRNIRKVSSKIGNLWSNERARDIITVGYCALIYPRKITD